MHLNCYLLLNLIFTIFQLFGALVYTVWEKLMLSRETITPHQPAAASDRYLSPPPCRMRAGHRPRTDLFQVGSGNLKHIGACPSQFPPLRIKRPGNLQLGPDVHKPRTQITTTGAETSPSYCKHGRKKFVFFLVEHGVFAYCRLTTANWCTLMACSGHIQCNCTIRLH